MTKKRGVTCLQLVPMGFDPSPAGERSHPHREGVPVHCVINGPGPL